MEGISLHILNLQPELHGEFFADVQLPEDVTVNVYKTYPSFIKAIQAKGTVSANLLLFLPEHGLDMGRTRRIRLIQIDSPIYIVTKDCSERNYLTYLSLGVSGIFHPPFNRGDVQRVLNGNKVEEIPFPRNNELAREGQVRLDFLFPSKLSRILGVNRLVSFLATEFGFPPEECKVNLPLVMDEALSNAILHGNKGREDLKVHVSIYISSRRIVIQVEDQGEGYIPDEEKDPTKREHIYKDSGRGIYLIKELMDGVTFKKNGRVLEMEKINPFFKE